MEAPATLAAPAQLTPEALGELFEEHARAIYNYCFRRTADWATAEDLTSAVFLEAWRRRASVDLVSMPALPWLYGVATNLLRNHRRTLRRYKSALERVPPPSPTPDFAEDSAERLDGERRMREVLADVERLSKEQQDVLALCVWADLSYEDAAQALDVPVGTVRSRLARARAELASLQEARTT